MASRRPLVDKFWEKVAKRGVDECWLWQAAVNRCGYGRLHNELAHRVSWRLHNGDIPEGLGVLHRCDTPGCVNPNHLFLGTHLDNMRDALAKGRLVKVVGPKLSGETHPRARLSQVQIDSIRGLLGKATQAEIGRRFGICQSHVSKIATGDRWTHGK